MSETEAQTTKKRTKKDDYIVQGSILAAAAVLTKITPVLRQVVRSHTRLHFKP